MEIEFMNIGNYAFTEPKKIGITDIIERAAVYVVMTHNGASWFYLYVGQTKDVAERFDRHEKWGCWLNNQMSGGLWVSILSVSDKNQRLNVETDLRSKLPGLSCNKQ